MAEALIAQRWHIFDPGVIDVKIQLNPDPAAPSASIANYEFSVNVKSGRTGLYVVRNWNYECEPGNSGDQQSGWFRGNTFRVNVVRCGLGSLTNDGFEVIARLGPTSPEIALTPTGAIKQAWHQEDRRVTYTLVTSPPIKGTKPADVFTSNFKAGELADSVTDAVGVLNKAIRQSRGSDAFFPDANGEVTIEAYWDGATGCSRPSAIACYTIDGSYPHMEARTLYVRYPPYVYDVTSAGSNIYAVWTNDPAVMKLTDNLNTEGSALFLPAVLLHEFGHTLGVNHLPETWPKDHHRMDSWYDPPSSNMTLSSSDLYGMVQSLSEHH